MTFSYRLSIILLVLTAVSCIRKPSDYNTWEVYRGSKTANQYSALDRINTENVKDLEVAWTYQTGGHTEKSTIQCNPIIIGRTIYVTSPDLRVIALDAASGREIWQYNPSQENKIGGVNRGVTYWEEEDDQRIFFTAGHWLIALDARSGEVIGSFGDGGKVDLRYDLGVPPESVTLSVTSPGIIFEDVLILGSALGEGYKAAPGHVRAYNVRSGAVEWIFHTIPQPGEFGYEAWERREGETFGGANAWGGLSLDEKRGWVFAATGSVAFDFYGGGRKGKNLFANCVLALDASTGERVWHYQIVHHDIWDYDLPCAPNLVNIEVEGEKVEAVAQPTKMGYLFLLDRETGRPLHPVEERPFPASTTPGETAWPTQPIPSFPEFFVRPGLSEKDLTGISEESNKFAMQRFREFEGAGLFTPPSLQGSLAMPGTRGGAEWSGASFDPETGILYINANEMASILKLKEVEVNVAPAVSVGKDATLAERVQTGRALYRLNCASCHGMEKQGSMPTYPPLTGLAENYHKKEVEQIISQGKGSMAAFAQFSPGELEAIVDFLYSEETEEASPDQGQTTTRYLLDGYRQFRDEQGYPANKPPWGTLNALDLNSGKLLWKVPLGEFPELTRQGIPPTGTQNLGGCVATAGGLVFVGAAKDEKFRAFDKRTGEILWEYQLPYGGYATPSVYEIEGRQYVVIAAGGGGKNATKSGDFYVAFNLSSASQ